MNTLTDPGGPIWPSRRLARGALAPVIVLAMLGATSAAFGQAVFFDFETEPNDGNPASMGSITEPVYVDAATGFTLSHAAAGVGAIGNVQWTNDDRSRPAFAGTLRLTSATPSDDFESFEASAHFSTPVMSLTMQISNSGASNATITPILDSGLGTPISVAPSGSFYGELTISEDEPLIGLHFFSPSVANHLYWDDLELTLEEDDGEVVVPPRNGLYGGSRPWGLGPPFKLNAIDPFSVPASGQVIGTVPGVSLSGLAREPSSGTLYGFNGLDGSGNFRLFVVDARSGALTDEYPIVVSDGQAAGAFVVGVLGADFAPDGTLYGVIEIFFPSVEPGGGGTFASYFAEIPTTPDAGTIVVEQIELLPENATAGLAINPADGHIWTVSLATSSAPNVLREYRLNGSLIQEAAYALSGVPGDGFASLQFSCGSTPTLYAANLESVDGDDVPQRDGGQLYTIDTLTGAITFLGAVTDGDGISSLAPATSCGTTSVQNSPTPPGDDVTVVSIEGFEQVGNVVAAGTTSASFCVGPDLRQLTLRRGREVYFPRPLWLRELAGHGSCTGLIPDSDPPVTWEALLDDIYLHVPAAWRSFKGEFTLPGDVTPTEGYWIVVGVVQTTAEFEGPVGIATFPETLIDYSNTPMGQRPDCTNDPDYRTLDLGGAVEAFGEFQNVEDERMIPQTVQCNGPRSMTRRTTHAYPLRLDGSRIDEEVNIHRQLNGILGTIAEASGLCTDAGTLATLSQMQSSLTAARFAVFGRRWEDAIADLEQIARYADNDPDGFGSCPTPANYGGNFMSRGLGAAFTVHDRFLHDDAYVKYFIPNDLDVPPVFDQELVEP